MAGWPHFSEDEIDAVVSVLRSGRVNYWTGEHGRCFEREFAELCDVPHAVAISNGSVGLELALHALGVGTGDEVIVTPRTFVATASSVVLKGATPVFVDVDRDSQNITAGTIESAITPRTRAVIIVHLAGWPCEMDEITALCQRRGLSLIEDCAQAQGAQYRGRPVGSFGDAGVFSFCQDKITTTGGEGGMLVTSKREVWRSAWSYKDHGKSYDSVHAPRDPSEHGFRWLHQTFGTNFRMTEMQSAIGRQQLRKLPAWLACRRRNAAMLDDILCEAPGLRLVIPPEHLAHAYYKYYVFLEPQALKPGWNRNRIVATMNDRRAPCFSGSCPEVYLEESFGSAGLRPAARLPVAESLGETSLMLLVDHTVEPAMLEHVGRTLLDVMREATA